MTKFAAKNQIIEFVLENSVKPGADIILPAVWTILFAFDPVTNAILTVQNVALGALFRQLNNKLAN